MKQKHILPPDQTPINLVLFTPGYSSEWGFDARREKLKTTFA